MAHVVLLRSPSQDGPDKYEAVLRSRGYQPLSIPVLETTLVNLNALLEIMKKGPGENNLDGVIITSARACEAWSNAVERLIGSRVCENADWRTVPFYVVGDATAIALEDIARKTDNSCYAPDPQNIRGRDQAGTSEKLAHYILHDLQRTGSEASTHESRRKKLLYLTGDKNRDTLPKVLHEGGIGLHSLQVYGTQGSSTFENELVAGLDVVPDDSHPWWLVYFAPSAADFVTPILRNYFVLLASDGKREHNSPTVARELPQGYRRDARVAAIGPTTAAFLGDTLHIAVHATAAKPSPEGLVEAIEHF